MQQHTSRTHRACIAYSPASSVRTPTRRVVTTRRGTCRRRGHSTARFSPMVMSHVWSHAYWRDTRVAAAASRLNSRPAARLRTSEHEASPTPLHSSSSHPPAHPLPPRHPIVSHSVARASEIEPEGLLRPTFIPTTQRPTPFIPLRRAVTRPLGG